MNYKKTIKYRELQITIEIGLYKHMIERKFKESNHWLKATINSIGDAVIATDTDGTIKLMNPLAEVMTGWKQEEASGKPLLRIFNVVCGEMSEQVIDPIKKVKRESSFYGLGDNTVLLAKNDTKYQ